MIVNNISRLSRLWDTLKFHENQVCSWTHNPARVKCSLWKIWKKKCNYRKSDYERWKWCKKAIKQAQSVARPFVISIAVTIVFIVNIFVCSDCLFVCLFILILFALVFVFQFKIKFAVTLHLIKDFIYN